MRRSISSQSPPTASLRCMRSNGMFPWAFVHRLYFHEVSAHTSLSKLSEPLGLVAESLRKVVASA